MGLIYLAVKHHPFVQLAHSLPQDARNVSYA